MRKCWPLFGGMLERRIAEHKRNVMVPPNPNITGSWPRAIALLALVGLYAMLLCIGAAGLNSGWRGPIEMLNAIDLNGLARGWHNAMAEPFDALVAISTLAAVHAPIGALAAVALGRSCRTAFLAAVLGFDVSVAEQAVHWLRPGHAPSISAPVVAALAALAGWYVVCRSLRQRPFGRGAGGWFVSVTVFLQAFALIAACVAWLGYSLGALGMTPSQLATVLTLHGAGHGPAITDVIRSSASFLEGLDRMDLNRDLPPPTWAGANMRSDVPRPSGRLRQVGSIATLREAIADARPGDVIELLPGVYQLTGTIKITQAGSSEFPVVMRAATLGSAVIEATTVEAFKLSAAYWVFENLVMRGTCTDDSKCDHAFHVVDRAVGSEFHNLRLEDFNAHFKINGEGGGFPDGGRIDHVTLIDTNPRRTSAPVTPIDLDAASDWIITDNFLADFAKAGGDQVSYGGYAKAAGSGNVFERNVVVCEWHLRAQPGQRIGLSFGGGGSDPGIRRDLGGSGYEQSDSVMWDNLIVACSDDGIYINRSPGSLVLHNTLIDTAGIDARYPESIVTTRTNIVDGPIRARDGGLIWQDDNVSTGFWDLFRGIHPVRAAFADPARFDLRWRNAPSGVVSGGDEAERGSAEKESVSCGLIGYRQPC
jgi:hypothetical protein